MPLRPAAASDTTGLCRLTSGPWVETSLLKMSGTVAPALHCCHPTLTGEYTPSQGPKSATLYHSSALLGACACGLAVGGMYRGLLDHEFGTARQQLCVDLPQGPFAMTPPRRLSGFIIMPEDLEAPAEAACRVFECAGTRLLLVVPHILSFRGTTS